MDIILVIVGILCLIVASKRGKKGKTNKGLKGLGWCAVGLGVVYFLVAFGLGVQNGLPRAQEHKQVEDHKLQD